MSSEALERAQKSLVRLHGTAFSEDGKTCPACAVEDVLRELDAALAVAREREQRAAEALRLIGLKTGWPCNHERWREVARIARAALVDEPAAATLAEPGKARSTSGRDADEAAGSRSAPGSASAAADEPGETPA